MKISKNILFVCTGNTCRSPFAELLLKKMVQERWGDDSIRVSSAGTYAFSGVEPPPNALKAAKEFGVDMSRHKSRSIHLSMLEASDVVLCMTSHHKSSLLAKFPWFEEKIKVLKAYADGREEAKEEDDIPDPIGQDVNFYVDVYTQIKEAIEKILKQWEEERKSQATYTIAIGSDHAGFYLKEKIKSKLIQWGHRVKDFGTHSGDVSVDYPDYARPVAEGVAKGDFKYGILVCGSGVGVSITANRVKGVRAALVRDVLTAQLSRMHNDANVLCLGGRFTAPEYAYEILQRWLSTSFEGGRHERRVKKIDES